MKIAATSLRAPTRHAADECCPSELIHLELGPATLSGDLHIPVQATGLVLFAHGSGSSRHSPRNRLVAEALNESDFATLLLDLLTEAEGTDRRRVFDIDLLEIRLRAAIRWARGHAQLGRLPIGLFGASTGAAAALAAAAEEPDLVRAVVSRGGRPDLVSARRLRRVVAPTLLIVGGADTTVLELNRGAATHLGVDHSIHIVPHATHLFEEPGALEEVATQAGNWFIRYLAP